VPDITLPDTEEINLNQSLQRLLGVIARRRWWVLLPAAGTVFATFIALSLLPQKYSSEALLLVVQQQVPQRYVLPTTTTDISEALQATTQEVLSRTRLLGIIDEFSLYAKERKRLSPEALLERIRHDISIEPLESHSMQKPNDVNSFRISFVADDPQLAQEVTSKLTSLFIQQNTETREHQATTTTNFLSEQLEATKNKLAEAEEQVRNFKMHHLGELPEQQPGNLAILNGLQGQLQNTTLSLSRAQEQRQYLESLSGYRALMAQSDLTRLKSERATLLSMYTPQYPTVIKINEKIAETEALIRMLTPSSASPHGTQNVPADAPIAPATAPKEDLTIGQLRSQVESNRLEIENLTKEQAQLKMTIQQYQMRLNQTPVREQELTAILRNYELLKQDYADKLNKKMESQMAGNLEKRQEGQQFRLIDRPSLPTVPSSPNRMKISLGGAAGGIGLGLALALLMGMTDRSFHSEQELSNRLAFQFVVGVPLIRTAWEERSRTRKRALEWVAGSVLSLAVLVAQFYEFYLYRHG
jgi:polysaccharide biosynthesis transport protein